VSGAAALVLSRCPLSTADLKSTIIWTVEAIPALAGKTITGGRLDVNSAVRSCTEPPAVPVLTNVNGDRQVILTWTGGAGATSFNVKRSLTAGGPYTVIASNVRARTYTDSSVTNDTTYYYVVSGTNLLGEGPLSNEVVATPKSPSDLVISAFTVPASGGAGLPVTMTVTVKNQGLGNADPSSARVYLSDDTFVDASDVPLGTIAVPALAAGAVYSSTLTPSLPATTTTGLHYLIAVADPDKTILESNETNNTLTRSFLVGPDLVVTAWSAPSSAAPGATISITDTITNQGGGTAPASTTRYYLSVNAGLDSSDIQLPGGRAVPGLAPGAVSTGTASFTIPSDIAAATYYLFIKADADNVVAESQEFNNTALKTINIGGDLVVSSFTAPGTAGPGSAIVVTDTTANTGTAAVAASTTRFYLSANAGLDASDILLDGAHAVPALAAGASHTASTTVVIPASVTIGSYFLIAKADADGVVPETAEFNNISLRSLQIGADLVISSITIPAKGGAGMPIAISDTTTNQGAAPTPPTQTRFYLSTNLTLDSGDTLLSARDVPSLVPGQSSSASTTVTLPANAPSGVLYILVQADATNAVAEISETNNVSFRSILVGPDLIVSALSVPSKGGIGSSLDVTDTVVNQGAGTSAASTVRYYLATSVLLDSKATLLAGGRAVPGLAPGDSNTGTTTLTIPASTLAGSYYILAAADGDNVVPESQETNNTAARSIAVGPDLIESGLAAPSTAAAGATITVSETATNQGIGTADPTTTRFYLSVNVLFDLSDVLLTGSRAVPSLPSGAPSTGQSQVVIPAGTAPGYYFLLAVSDGDNVVREASESNNSVARSIQVTAP
jgi:subtilase family serine protease